MNSEELDYKKHLNLYFEIKNNYEEKEKKRKTSERKCIKCGKLGGTIFSNKNNRYIAVCGAETPCNLLLELYRGYFSNSVNLLYQYVKLLEDSKDIIIMLQSNGIFHFESSNNLVKSQYEDEKKQYDTLTSLFTELKKCLYDNEEIKDKIKEKVKNINEIIIEVRSMIQEYKKSGNTEFIQSAVKQQKNQLIPLLEELRDLKYEVIEMDINKLTTTKRYMKEEE